MEVISDALGASTMTWTPGDPEAKEVLERLKKQEACVIHLHVYHTQDRGLAIYIDKDEIKGVGDGISQKIILLAAMESMAKQAALATGTSPAELVCTMLEQFVAEEAAQMNKEGKQ